VGRVRVVPVWGCPVCRGGCGFLALGDEENVFTPPRPLRSPDLGDNGTRVSTTTCCDRDTFGRAG